MKKYFKDDRISEGIFNIKQSFWKWPNSCSPACFIANKKVDFQCYSFFEDGTKLKIFSEIYLSLTAMNWLYGRMNRFHLPWTKVQPKFERKCRPSIIILVWSNTYSALECKFNSILFKTVFKLFVTFFSSSKAFVFVKKNFVTSELQTKCQKKWKFPAKNIDVS